MKQTSSEKFEADAAQRDAAHMLLVDYIGKNPEQIARAIEKIIPFFYECTFSGLQIAMNTVNATIASVALNVIKSCATEEDDADKMNLPVDAEEMETAIYYLSRFIKLFGPLAALSNDHSIPAMRMCQEAFGKIDVTSC